jgi:hypothetical protein
MPTPTSDLLADFAETGQLAKEFKRHERTVRNWTNEPNGLPFVKLGKRRLIHIPTAREWLLKKLRQPNPVRRRRGRTR